MKRNIMVIGNSKEEANKDTEQVSKHSAAGAPDAAPGTGRETVQEQVYEKDWSNEHEVLRKLEGKLLADRRLYVRALYMKRIECNILFDSLDAEPSILPEPIRFMIVDLSMGGIGIICEHGIAIGTILSFGLSLDNILYDIKCEVVYCFENNDKYRAGLKIVNRDRKFIRHLKIFVARLSLQSKYGAQ